MRADYLMIGGFLGAWLGGLALERNGNYLWMWYADMALALAAALSALIGLMGHMFGAEPLEVERHSKDLGVVQIDDMAAGKIFPVGAAALDAPHDDPTALALLAAPEMTVGSENAVATSVVPWATLNVSLPEYLFWK